MRVDPDPDTEGAELFSQPSPFERVEMITPSGSRMSHLRVHLPGGTWCDPIDPSLADGHCECSTADQLNAGCEMRARIIRFDEPSRGPNHQLPMLLPHEHDDAPLHQP